MQTLIVSYYSKFCAKIISLASVRAMLSRQIFIYFYLLLLKYCALAQNVFCTFDSSSVLIKCEDRLNPMLYVRESENGCSGNKCWCIVLDNQNHIYDGEVIVELVHIFKRGNLYPDEIQRSIVILTKVFPGINSWSVTAYQSPGAISKIATIKISNNEICRFSTSDQRYDGEEPTNGTISFTSLFEDNSNRYYSDCASRTGYTANAMRYCQVGRQEFTVEKRYMRNGEAYWCIIINNDQNVFTLANQLHILYSGPYQHIYSPLGAYIGRDEPGSEFHLGSPQTIIAISEYRKQLTNLISITIDNQSICSYFEQRTAPLFQSRQYPTGSVDYQMIEPPPVKPHSSPQKCGMKPTKKNALIAYGTKTNLGDWPWHAAVYKHKSITNRILICGGTLIDPKTIITAAHCVIESNKVVTDSRLSVELGRHNLGDITSMATQQLRVYDVIQHDLYRPDTFENDIAILVLATYVQITQYVNYVCLPQPHEMFENRMGTTVGWELDNDSETDLKEVTLPVVPDIMCLESNREFFGAYMTETNFCAGHMNRTNVCRGDSGGGLVFKSNGYWVLGGITSLGVLSRTDEHHCDLKQYVIFTNVAKYLSWIEEYLIFREEPSLGL